MERWYPPKQMKRQPFAEMVQSLQEAENPFYSRFNAVLAKSGGDKFVALIKNQHEAPNRFEVEWTNGDYDAFICSGRYPEIEDFIDYLHRVFSGAEIEIYGYTYGGESPKLVFKSVGPKRERKASRPRRVFR